MNTDIIEEEPPNHEEDKIPNDAITNDDTFGAESSDQIFKKRGIKSRFQKSRVIRGWNDFLAMKSKLSYFRSKILISATIVHVYKPQELKKQ